MPTSISKDNKELFILLFVYSIIFVSYWFIQPHVSFEQEPLLDAHQYLKSYLFFKGDLTTYTVNYPFNHRIGIPFLASLIPLENILLRFSLIHFIFIGGSIVCYYLSWKYLRVPLLFQLWFWLWFFFHWVSPIRYGMHEPISVDSAHHFFCSLFILLFTTNKTIHYWWLIPLSVCFKESLVPYVLVFTVFHFLIKHDNKAGLQYLGVFSIGIAALYVVRSLFPMNEYNWKYQSVITVLWYLKYFVIHPIENIRWIASLITSWGILVVFLPYSKALFKRIEFYLFVGAVLLGFLSGTDQTRIFFASFGFFALIVVQLAPRKGLIIFCLVCSIPFLRLFQLLPDVVNKEIYHAWYPEFTPWGTITKLFTYVALCYLAWKVIKKIDFTPPSWIRKRL